MHFGLSQEFVIFRLFTTSKPSKVLFLKKKKIKDNDMCHNAEESLLNLSEADYLMYFCFTL